MTDGYVTAVTTVLLGYLRSTLVDVADKGELTQEANDTLVAALGPGAAGMVLDELEAKGDAKAINPAKGQAVPSNLKVLQKTNDCVLASLNLDLTSLFTNAPTKDAIWHIRLEKADPPSNVTPWRAAYLAPSSRGLPPVVDCRS